jgi:hypothetical protein
MAARAFVRVATASRRHCSTERNRLSGSLVSEVGVSEEPEREGGPAVALGAGVDAVGRSHWIQVLLVEGCDALFGVLERVGEHTLVEQAAGQQLVRIRHEPAARRRTGERERNRPTLGPTLGRELDDVGSSSHPQRPRMGEDENRLAEPIQRAGFVLGSSRPLPAFGVSWARRGHRQEVLTAGMEYVRAWPSSHGTESLGRRGEARGAFPDGRAQWSLGVGWPAGEGGLVRVDTALESGVGSAARAGVLRQGRAG